MICRFECPLRSAWIFSRLPITGYVWDLYTYFFFCDPCWRVNGSSWHGLLMINARREKRLAEFMCFKTHPQKRCSATSAHIPLAKQLSWKIPVVCDARAYSPSTEMTWQVQRVEGFGINTATYHCAHASTNNMVYLQHLEKQ